MGNRIGFNARAKNVFRILSILVIIEWMLVLNGSDAFFSGYLLWGGVGIALLCTEKNSGDRRKSDNPVIHILSALLSAAIALANYSIIHNVWQSCVMLYAGYACIERTLHTTNVDICHPII